MLPRRNKLMVPIFIIFSAVLVGVKWAWVFMLCDFDSNGLSAGKEKQSRIINHHSLDSPLREEREGGGAEQRWGWKWEWKENREMYRKDETKGREMDHIHHFINILLIQVFGPVTSSSLKIPTASAAHFWSFFFGVEKLQFSPCLIVTFRGLFSHKLVKYKPKTLLSSTMFIKVKRKQTVLIQMPKSQRIVWIILFHTKKHCQDKSW